MSEQRIPSEAFHVKPLTVSDTLAPKLINFKLQPPRVETKFNLEVPQRVQQVVCSGIHYLDRFINGQTALRKQGGFESPILLDLVCFWRKTFRNIFHSSSSVGAVPPKRDSGFGHSDPTEEDPTTHSKQRSA